MKFLKNEGNQLVFQMSKREKALLTDLLKLYPLIPPAHHQVNTGENSRAYQANQQLLDEALAEHRADIKKQLEAMLHDEDRFQEVASGFLFLLTEAEMEWLLQVLNDIRVGSWLLLGSPDEKKGKSARLTLQTARYLWAMEMCGHFQHIFITKPERK